MQRQQTVTLKSEDLPIILLGSLNDIRTMTRFQKLAFLYEMEVCKDQSDIYEWNAHHYGPYSYGLKDAIHKNVEDGLIKHEKQPHPATHDLVSYYSLTESGRTKFHEMEEKNRELICHIRKHLHSYQLQRTNIGMLVYIYDNYRGFVK